MNNKNDMEFLEEGSRFTHFSKQAPNPISQHEFLINMEAMVKKYKSENKREALFRERGEQIISNIKNFSEIRIKLERKEIEEDKLIETYLNLPFKYVYLTFFGDYTFCTASRNMVSQDRDYITQHNIRALYIIEESPYHIKVRLLSESFNFKTEKPSLYYGILKDHDKRYAFITDIDLVFNKDKKIYEPENSCLFAQEALFLIRELCIQINSKRTVIHQVETNDAITIKRYPKKIRHKVRTILYIHNKEDVIKNNKALKINLSCPYRFTVRGHWRKLKDDTHFGKDREGNYTVQGLTWITDFIKGDIEKPLKETIRVVC